MGTKQSFLRLTKTLLTPRRIWFLSIIICVQLLYLTTTPHHPVAIGDSDEIIALGSKLSLIHSPGYPLLTSLVFLTQFIPLPTSLAFKANFLSTFFEALAVALVGLITHEIIKDSNSSSVSKNRYELLTLSLGILIIASNNLIWLYGSVMEVFSLNNLLVLLAFWLALRLRSQFLKTNLIKPLWHNVFIIVIGLMLSHHQTSFLALPGIILLLPKAMPRKKRTIIGATSVWLLVQLCLFLINNQTGSGWHFDPTLNGWWGYIWRSPYAGNLANGQFVKGAFISAVDWSASISTYKHFILHWLPLHYGFTGLSLMTIGIIASRKTINPTIWISLSLTFILMMVILPLYLTVPPTDVHTQAITERMYVLGYIISGIWVVLGCWTLAHFIMLKTNTSLALVSITCLTLIFFCIVSIPRSVELQLSSYHPIDASFQASLTKMPANAVIMCFSDVSCFSLLYLKTINAISPTFNLIALPEQLQLKVQKSKSLPVGFKENPWRIFEAVKVARRDDHPIFVSEINEYYVELLGLSGELFQLSPTPLLQEVSCGLVSSWQPSIPSLSQLPHLVLFSQVHHQLLSSLPNTPPTDCRDPEELEKLANSCQEPTCKLGYLSWAWMMGSPVLEHLWSQSQQ